MTCTQSCSHCSAPPITWWKSMHLAIHPLLRLTAGTLQLPPPGCLSPTFLFKGPQRPWAFSLSQHTLLYGPSPKGRLSKRKSQCNVWPSYYRGPLVPFQPPLLPEAASILTIAQKDMIFQITQPGKVGSSEIALMKQTSRMAPGGLCRKGVHCIGWCSFEKVGCNGLSCGRTLSNTYNYMGCTSFERLNYIMCLVQKGRIREIELLRPCLFSKRKC